MKVVIGGVAAAILLASSAWAQTGVPASSACQGFDAAPTLADGASATAAQMSAANQAYQNWAQARVAKLQSCRAEVDALRAQLNALEAGYNTGNGELSAVTQGWQADVEEYNARSSSGQGRRERGGVLTRPD